MPDSGLGLVRISKMPLSGLGLVENLPPFHLTTALPPPPPTPFGKLTRDKPPGALRGGSKKAATHMLGGGCQGPGITLRQPTQGSEIWSCSSSVSLEHADQHTDGSPWHPELSAHTHNWHPQLESLSAAGICPTFLVPILPRRSLTPHFRSLKRHCPPYPPLPVSDRWHVPAYSPRMDESSRAQAWSYG